MAQSRGGCYWESTEDAGLELVPGTLKVSEVQGLVEVFNVDIKAKGSLPRPLESGSYLPQATGSMLSGDNEQERPRQPQDMRHSG